MAYQNVGGTPRFYIDTPSYLDSIGAEYIAEEVSTDMTLSKDLFGLNPNNPVLIGNTESMTVKITLPNKLGSLFDTTKGYVGFLNHSISDDVFFQMISDLPNKNSIINVEAGIGPQATKIYKKGFSIFNFSESLDTPHNTIKLRDIYYADTITYDNLPFYMGCITFGSYYDMPTSPDLDLSMDIEFDGVNNIKTLNGSTITQANYHGSPWWYDVDGNKVEPWSVGESTGISKRNGRRIWSLKFSYMSDKNLFASNYGSSTYMETDTDVDPEDIDDLNLGQSILTNGDFSAGTTGWYFSDCSGTIGTYFGFNNVCQIEVDSPDTVGMYQANVTVEDVTYKYSFDYYIPSGNTNLDAVQLRANSSSNNKIIDSQTVTDTWTSVYAYYTPTSSATDDIWIYLNSTSTGGNDLTVGNSIYVKNIKIEPINGDDFQYTIDTDDSFSAQVLNKISHGEKFIFQPDNTANNPSDFAICVLDGDSFSMKRTAPNVYDIEMKIREVW